MKNLVRTTTFLAIVACFLWSTAFATVKIGLLYQKPFQFAGLRFIISGILIFIWLGKPIKYFREVAIHWKFISSIAFVQTALQYAFFYTGMSLVPGALGAMLVGASPLFITLVAHFFSENDRFTLNKSFSLLLGIAGLALITLGRTRIEIKNHLEWLGMLLLLFNNFLSGYANVMIKKSPSPVSPYILSSASLALGGLLLLIISIPVEGIATGPFPLPYYLSLGWLSFLSAAAFSIWYKLLKRPGVKVSDLNIWKFIIPVSGAMLSWILIPGEKPEIISVTGMAVIALSLLILFSRQMKLKKELST